MYTTSEMWRPVSLYPVALFLLGIFLPLALSFVPVFNTHDQLVFMSFVALQLGVLACGILEWSSAAGKIAVLGSATLLGLYVGFIAIVVIGIQNGAPF